MFYLEIPQILIQYVIDTVGVLFCMLFIHLLLISNLLKVEYKLVIKLQKYFIVHFIYNSYVKIDVF